MVEASCYQVNEQAHGWWGYFTITPANGLLQVYSDFGNCAYRWTAFGSDFKAFLVRITDDYLVDKLVSGGISSQRAAELLTQHLWPLFVEKLKAELKTEAQTL